MVFVKKKTVFLLFRPLTKKHLNQICDKTERKCFKVKKMRHFGKKTAFLIKKKTCVVVSMLSVGFMFLQCA